MDGHHYQAKRDSERRGLGGMASSDFRNVRVPWEVCLMNATPILREGEGRVWIGRREGWGWRVVGEGGKALL